MFSISVKNKDNWIILLLRNNIFTKRNKLKIKHCKLGKILLSYDKKLYSNHFPHNAKLNAFILLPSSLGEFL